MTHHLAWPVRLDPSTGGLATVAQDSPDEVAQCVAVLLSTEVGVRAEMPAYGITDPTFGRVVNVAEVAGAIATYEPRAEGAELTETLDDLDPLVREFLVDLDPQRRPSP